MVNGCCGVRVPCSRGAWCVFRGREVGFSQINADKIRRFTRIPELSCTTQTDLAW
jgi:hypothetical protein